MNIGFNTNMRSVPPTELMRAGETPVAPKRTDWASSAKGVDDLMAVGGEIAVPDGALDRNDALGRLVRQAYGI